MHIHVPHINQEPFSNSQKQLTVNYSSQISQDLTGQRQNTNYTVQKVSILTKRNKKTKKVNFKNGIALLQISNFIRLCKQSFKVSVNICILKFQMVQQKDEQECSFYRILIYLLKPTIILTTKGFPVTKSLILSTLDLK